MKILASSRASERGNVMFYILIGITLLAALIFAVSQSGRGSVQQVNEERAKLLASEIIDYANSVATAYAQLRLRGCKLEHMSFESILNPGYENIGAPTDKTCDLFELAGGGITFKSPPPEAIANGGSLRQIFSGEVEVHQVGTTCGADSCADIVMFTGQLSERVCIEINNKLAVGEKGVGPPEAEADTASASPYIGLGSIAYAETIGEEPTAAILSAKTAGCYNDTDSYYFYKVLQAR